MKQFREIFGKVMVDVNLTEVAMLGTDVPVVTIKGQTWAEFTTWANKSFSPNLQIGEAWISGCSTCIHAKILGTFFEKSASTLNAHFKEWSITAEEDCDEDGRPINCPALMLNIAIIPNV